ncbi:MAG: FAD-binding oxidoreductase [Alphaproteobacteria bacterium]|nr:FAD-binding oxidoreductase [Alphaproteobacteria bacterium]
MTERCDFIVIGAGAAGSAVAHALSSRGRVAVLERESAPAYHSTGRSAAVLAENYGPVLWQRLSTASRPFFEQPPAGFAEHKLLRPLGALFFATAAETGALEDSARELARRGVAHRLMTPREALALCPVVRIESFALALHEPGCADIDAAALVQGCLKLARRNGATVMLDAGVDAIERGGGQWQVRTRGATLRARVLVNAAGAWCDDIAALAGLKRRGVRPYRRTAITFDPPAGHDSSRWPMTFDVAETWYFKPEGGRIMASPVDKSLSAPCDCQPEELDIAVAADRIQQATTMEVRRIARSWAGLRTFAPDEQPVIGPDPQEPGFIWLAGQGGNGVMAAPAAAELAASLALGEGVPQALRALGIDAAAVAPGRLPAA